VHRRDCAARDLDPLDQCRIQREEIERAAAAVGGVIELDAVDEDHGEIGLAAANRQERAAADPAVGKGADAGEVVERLEQRSGLAARDVVGPDHADAGDRADGGPGRGDDDRGGLGGWLRKVRDDH
jgi:hypothetical protein